MHHRLKAAHESVVEIAAKIGCQYDYARKLLAAFPASKGTPGRLPQIRKSEITTSEILEPLSVRELEVLRLINQGLSNRQIGQKLVISLPTVKSHTGNIYSKLGVSSRTQAVAKARTLRLL